MNPVALTPVLVSLSVLLGTEVQQPASASLSGPVVYPNPAPTTSQDSQDGWTFSFSPMVELWFHGMALVDPIGPGPTPLYDPAYPGTIMTSRQALGVTLPPLRGRAGEFRERFRADMAMEVLHFLPLYFPRSGRLEVLLALRALSENPRGIPGAPSPTTGFGMAAIGAVLPNPAERHLLGEFVSALDEEWNVFYREFRAGRAQDRARMEREVQGVWDRDFAIPLGGLLAGLNMESGIAFLVPALGIEGRVFTGVPSRQSDNALAISSPASDENPRTAIYALLRELSFSIARQAMKVSGARPSEKLVGIGATRAGALILEALVPREVEHYQQFFLSRAGRAPPPGEAPASAFQAHFRLEEAQLDALRDTINRVITDGGEF